MARRTRMTLAAAVAAGAGASVLEILDARSILLVGLAALTAGLAAFILQGRSSSSLERQVANLVARHDAGLEALRREVADLSRGSRDTDRQ